MQNRNSIYDIANHIVDSSNGLTSDFATVPVVTTATTTLTSTPPPSRFFYILFWLCFLRMCAFCRKWIGNIIYINTWYARIRRVMCTTFWYIFSCWKIAMPTPNARTHTHTPLQCEEKLIGWKESVKSNVNVNTSAKFKLNEFVANCNRIHDYRVRSAHTGAHRSRDLEPAFNRKS